jgi:predicted membrane protein
MDSQINNTQHKYNKNTIAGFALLFIGLAILTKHIGFFLFPHFLFSWPVIMILVGLYVGSRNNFKKSNWILITGMGILFLLPNIIPSLGIASLWPLLFVAVGINMLARHNQKWNGQNWEKRNDNQFHSFDNNI